MKLHTEYRKKNNRAATNYNCKVKNYKVQSKKEKCIQPVLTTNM